MPRLRLTDIRVEDSAGMALGRAAPTADRLQESIFRLLELNLLCSIATVSASGRPHVNTAYFAHSPLLELYFLSHPTSLHSKHLARNPATAVAVYSPAHQWTDPGQGLQMIGVCEQASGAAALDAERAYGRRFQAFAGWKHSLGRKDVAREYRFYRFAALAVKVLDERYLGDSVFVCAAVDRTPVGAAAPRGR